MKQSQLNSLIKTGKATAVVSEDPQPRQVVHTAGKLRVLVFKGDQNGKTNN